MYRDSQGHDADRLQMLTLVAQLRNYKLRLQYIYATTCAALDFGASKRARHARLTVYHLYMYLEAAT